MLLKLLTAVTQPSQEGTFQKIYTLQQALRANIMNQFSLLFTQN